MTSQPSCKRMLRIISEPEIKPLYIKNGVFCMEAKGRALMTGSNSDGKNSRGMIAPAKNSMTDVASMRIPVGERV